VGISQYAYFSIAVKIDVIRSMIIKFNFTVPGVTELMGHFFKGPQLSLQITYLLCTGLFLYNIFFLWGCSKCTDASDFDRFFKVVFDDFLGFKFSMKLH
jgi:hypothetical protein